MNAGYTAQAQEVLADTEGTVKASGSAGATHDEVRKGEDAAKRYAERYLGVTAAERAWYKRLGVSPYTDNTVLRAAVRKAARTELREREWELHELAAETAAH